MDPHELIGKGYYLIPVRRSSDPKKDKTALIAKWPELASRDPAQIDAWAQQFPGCNWGIVCKNCIVFDLDRKIKTGGVERILDDEEFFSYWNDIIDQFGHLQYPSVVTGNGGRHYYFKRPEEKVKLQTKLAYVKDGRKVTTNIDIRVGNGYVVAPGCVNGQGGEYVCEGGLWAVDELEELPKEFIDLLPKQADEAPKPAIRTAATGDLERKIYLCRLYAEKFDPAISGSKGHDQALRVSNAIFWGFDIPKEYGWPIFTEWNAKLEEKWSEKELEHKYSETMNKPPAKIERGSLCKRLYKRIGGDGGFDYEAAKRIVDELFDEINGAETENSFEDDDDFQEKFPLEYFPPEIRDYCQKVSESLSVDESLPGYLALSVASAANGYVSTYSRGVIRCQRALFHTLIVLYSGGGKSPTMKEMLFPVFERQNRANEEFLRDQHRYNEEKRTKKRGAPDPEPVKFVPCYKIPDATSEGLIEYWSKYERALIIDKNLSFSIKSLDEENQRKMRETIAFNKKGAVWFYDEASLLLEGMDAYKKASKDQAVYLQILDGGEGGTVRASESSNRHFSDSHTILIAGVQEETLRRIAKNEESFFYTGFFERINFAFPPFIERKGSTVNISEEKMREYDELKQAYRDKIEDIYNQSEVRDFRLSDEAEMLYSQYESEANEDLNMRGKLGARKTAADSAMMSTDSKSTKRVLDVALLLEVMDKAGKGIVEDVISARSMEGAIKIVRYCNRVFQKLVRYCCYSGGTTEGIMEDKIVRLLENAGDKGMSIRELMGKVFRHHTKRDIIDFMRTHLLERRETVKKKIEKNKHGKPTVRYYFVPKPKPEELPEEYDELEEFSEEFEAAEAVA